MIIKLFSFLMSGLLIINSSHALTLPKSRPDTPLIDIKFVESDGDKRQYRLASPSNYDPARPVGVVFGYHGGGPFSYLLQMRDLGFEDLANKANWITVSVAARPGHSWDPNPDLKKNKEFILVNEILKSLESEFNIDQNRIFAVGVSAGTTVVQALAEAEPNRMAAVAGIMAGYKQYIVPPGGSKYASLFIGGNRDHIFTRQGLKNFAKQYPDIYTFSDEFLDSMGPIGVSYFMDELIAAYQPRVNDLEVYYLNIGHEFPPDDTNTSPPLPYTHIIARFFTTHPRGYQTKVYPAPSFGKPFSETFNGRNGALLSSKRWRVISADSTGRFGNVKGARLVIDKGRLINEPTITTLENKVKDPVGAFAFTDFMKQPFAWQLDFGFDSQNEKVDVYPCIMRDMQGRVIFLKVSGQNWEWAWAEDHLAFHSSFAPKIHTLKKGKLRIKSNENVDVLHIIVTLLKKKIEWKLFDINLEANFNTAAAGDLQVLDIPLLDEMELGFGMIGKPDQRVEFFSAEVK